MKIKKVDPEVQNDEWKSLPVYQKQFLFLTGQLLQTLQRDDDLQLPECKLGTDKDCDCRCDNADGLLLP